MSRPNLLIPIVFLTINILATKGKQYGPPGMPEGLLPDPIFDKSLPFCYKHEPCGFYAMSLFRDDVKFTWINSHCRCPPKKECVFDRVDTKRQVYRETCVAVDLEEYPFSFL